MCVLFLEIEVYADTKHLLTSSLKKHVFYN